LRFAEKSQRGGGHASLLLPHKKKTKAKARHSSKDRKKGKKKKKIEKELAVHLHLLHLEHLDFMSLNTPRDREGLIKSLVAKKMT
jgi:hypothetical protein